MSLFIYANKNHFIRIGKKVLKTQTHQKKSGVHRTNYSGGVWGIDISHHQGTVNWNELVKHNKPDFIFLKCTEGTTFIDNKYKSYKKQANSKGITTGAYHFFSYRTPGKIQAQHFIKYSNHKRGDIVPVLDVEYTKNRSSNAKIRKEVKEFSKEIKKQLGVKPIIYTGYSFYKNILEGYFEDHHFWICDMSREPRCNYTFWQYTDRGHVKGIGNVDNNRMNDKYRLADFLLK